MGVIKRGILGGFSGRIGNVVGSSWKGIAVVKSLPLSVANPQTTGQTTQRNKFGYLVATASALLSYLVKPFWDRWASQMSGYNAFIQANIEDQPNDAGGPYEDMVISHGQMTPLPNVSASYNVGDGTLDVTFDTTTDGAYQSADDDIFAFAYDTYDAEYYFADSGVLREDGEVNITMPQPHDGYDVIYGVTARSADGYRAGAELAKKVG